MVIICFRYFFPKLLVRIYFSYLFITFLSHVAFNPLSDMPILGSSSSAANKDMVSKIWTNGVSKITLSRKHRGKRRNCSLRAISPFSTMFSKAVCCWCVKMSIYEVKGKESNEACIRIQRVKCNWLFHSIFPSFALNRVRSKVLDNTLSYVELWCHSDMFLIEIKSILEYVRCKT